MGNEVNDTEMIQTTGLFNKFAQKFTILLETNSIVDFTRDKYCEEAIKCPTGNEHKNILKI